MKIEKYEVLISNNKDLNQLLIENEITGLSNFSNAEFNNNEFKKYIEKSYENSFNEVCLKYSENSNNAKINSLLRSVEFLATKEVKISISEPLLIILNEALVKIEALKKSLSNNDKYFEVQAVELDTALNSVVINILNKFDDVKKIKDKKNQILKSSLTICDMISKSNAKREPFKYAIYNVIINNLEKVKNYDELNEHFSKHKKKITSKRTGIEIKYWVWTIFIIILLLIRLLSRMN